MKKLYKVSNSNKIQRYTESVCIILLTAVNIVYPCLTYSTTGSDSESEEEEEDEEEGGDAVHAGN